MKEDFFHVEKIYKESIRVLLVPYIKEMSKTASKDRKIYYEKLKEFVNNLDESPQEKELKTLSEACSNFTDIDLDIFIEAIEKYQYSSNKKDLNYWESIEKIRTSLLECRYDEEFN